MVNGLRYYPVANPVAQTFPHPVILNETGLPSALTKAVADDLPLLVLRLLLLLAEDYPRFRQIVRRQLDRHLVPGHDTDEVLAHFTRNMSQDIALAGQINAEHCPR